MREENKAYESVTNEDGTTTTSTTAQANSIAEGEHGHEFNLKGARVGQIMVSDADFQRYLDMGGTWNPKKAELPEEFTGPKKWKKRHK